MYDIGSHGQQKDTAAADLPAPQGVETKTLGCEKTVGASCLRCQTTVVLLHELINTSVSAQCSKVHEFCSGGQPAFPSVAGFHP